MKSATVKYLTWLLLALHVKLVSFSTGYSSSVSIWTLLNFSHSKSRQVSPPLHPKFPFRAQSIICWMLNVVFVSLWMANADSIVDITLYAQQAPHWPCFRTGETTPFSRLRNYSWGIDIEYVSLWVKYGRKSVNWTIYSRKKKTNTINTLYTYQSILFGKPLGVARFSVIA